MKLPFSNAFWVIVILLLFYGVFGLWVPNQAINEQEKMVNQFNQEMRRTIETLQPSVYEQELARHQDEVAYKLTPGDKLVIAAKVWDIPAMKQLIKAGADVNYIRNEGKTVNGMAVHGISPLMAGADNLEVVKLLVEAGADIHLKDSRGKTALMYALDALDRSYKDPKVSEYLMSLGADVKGNQQQGPTALMEAIYSEAPMQTIRQLVEKGADINAQNGILTALTIAAEKGRADVVKYFIEHGADLGRDAEQALTRAAEHGHGDVVALLNRFVTPSDEVAESSLEKAARNGDVETVRTLLERFDVSSGQGDQAMLTAVSKGHLEIVRLLVEAGADVNASYYKGSTALLLALWDKHSDVFEYLLSKGADIDAITPRDGPATALIRAARQARGDVLQALVQHGASQDITDQSGKTPLMVILGVGWHTDEYDLPNAKMTSMQIQLAEKSKETRSDILAGMNSLLTGNPAINVQDEEGNTAAIIAMLNHLPEIAPVLAGHGADLNLANKNGVSPMTIAASQYDFELCLQLAELGADINVQDWRGLSPLVYAVEKGDVLAVRRMIDKGADVNVRFRSNLPYYGDTYSVLEMVPENHFFEIAEMLVNAGLNLNSYDEMGQTLLTRSLIGIHANMRLFQFLLDKDIDINLPEKKYGDTPLMHYLRLGYLSNEQNIHALLNKGADPFKASNDGASPASMATDNLKLLRLFLSRGIDVPYDVNHILIQAMKQNDFEMFALALSKGADPNLRSGEGKEWYRATPLYWAVFQGGELFVKELLFHGADVDLGYQKLMPTPLIMAIEHDFGFETIKSMVEKTKNINAKAMAYRVVSGYTALDVAIKKDRQDVIKLLKDAGAEKAWADAPETTEASNQYLIKKVAGQFTEKIAAGKCDAARKMAKFPMFVTSTTIEEKQWDEFCAQWKNQFENVEVSKIYFPKDSRKFMAYLSVDYIRDVKLEEVVLVDLAAANRRPQSLLLTCTPYHCDVRGFEWGF